MKTQLTIKEALSEGFVYAAYNEEEFRNCYKIENLNELDFIYADAHHNGYVLCHKEAGHYGLAEDLISDLISDHIDCQDEFNDEDGVLSGIALEGCDDLLKQLTEKINTNLSKKNFYFQTDIKLINNLSI